MRILPSDARDYERWAGLDLPTDEEIREREWRTEVAIERAVEAYREERAEELAEERRIGRLVERATGGGG